MGRKSNYGEAHKRKAVTKSRFTIGTQGANTL
jgi:hypothetical protein